MTDGGHGAEVRIRPAVPVEAALLTALHGACFDGALGPRPTPWDDAAMSRFIAGPPTLCLLATVAAPEPAPAGFLIARTAADEAELLTIGVLAAYRGRGFGRALLQHAAKSLREAGIRQLFLEVDETNAPALALYRGLGAVAVGRRPGYYENGGNAAVLRLDLTS
ncbi:hypothetical protein AUC68_11685 [Methyloceanibacter methanicus]|uniref:N-acetyltransferase domain-containing protein n=1 Tax=Methyloceanibacter methanicus TaxID=1774968 RepID=A0A1E3W5E5_9HYPH|nr:N-acetyltransferase [Methyloceanibacter methanicus]ODS01045.1 hypothetical protein AUC68_11685 [Methyloceanibacter methanicus]